MKTSKIHKKTPMFQVNKKITVSIGIPACNEEANIKKLLTAVLNQNEKNFEIKEIVVISDGSKDQTVSRAKEVISPKIKVLDYPKRMGKPSRVNQFFSKTNSDIAIVLDADTKIYSESFIYELVKPMIEDKEVMLTSANEIPLFPRSLFQKIVYEGEILWQNAIRLVPRAEMYRCGGMARSFQKKLYKKIIFPSLSAEDVFPFLYCFQKGYKFKYAKNAKVFFSLPDNYKDYLKQMTRYLTSKTNQAQNFLTEPEIIKENYVIGFGVKARSVLIRLTKNPIFVILYLLFLLIPKSKKVFKNQVSSSMWDIVSSTKQ